VQRSSGTGAVPARPWPARVLAGAITLAVCGPLLAPGTALLRDMVVVPRSDLDADALGLSAAVPRAVPADAVLGVVTALVPGSLVQLLVLAGSVFAAVLGAARLVPARSGVAGLVAGAVYGWSPYLAERLLMGHWTLLAGLGALPWVVRAAARTGDRHGWARLALVAAPAALTPTGLLLSLGAAVAGGGRRRLGTVLLVHLGLAAPWVVAALTGPGTGSDPRGVTAFAANGEGPGGALWALLGSGGIWNAGAVPAGRGGWTAAAVTLALLLLAGAGWAGRPARHGAGGRVLALGLVGLALAAVGAVPGTAGLLERAVADLTGAGLLRDGQKWAAWWLLALAVGAGLGADRLLRRCRRRSPVLAAVAGGLLLALPVLGTPGLAWGAGGAVVPVAWPDDWTTVRDRLLAAPGSGDVVVLPAGAVRAFGWNADRPQLDPAQRWLPLPVVVDDRLAVDGVLLDGEDPRAAEVLAAVDDPAELARLGVGWVLVERGTPGPALPDGVAGLPLVVDGADLQLHRVPGVQVRPGASGVRAVAVVGAHLLAAAELVVAASVLAGAALRRRRTPLPNGPAPSTVCAARRTDGVDEKRTDP